MSESVIADVERIRWGAETKQAVEHLGWQVVETAGIDDYQGWGVHLIQRDGSWGVLHWGYGSCSGCDEYEDQFYFYSYEGRPDPMSDRGSPRHCAEVFGSLIEERVNEADARMLFDERKGW